MRNSTLTSIAVFDYLETCVCAALFRKKVGIHADSWEKVIRKGRNMLSLSLFHNSLRNRCIHLSVFILFPNVSSFSIYSNSIFDNWSHVYDTQYYQQYYRDQLYFLSSSSFIKTALLSSLFKYFVNRTTIESSLL